MITLTSPRLRVEIAEPGESPNTTHRFDRAGFITEIVLDGDTRFCATEPQNLPIPCTGGRGLCNEYLFDAAAEAEAGGRFPKFGIGLFGKEEEDEYVYHKRYKDVAPFEIVSRASAERAVFVTEPSPCLGYALWTRKTVSVSGDTLLMEAEAANVGEKGMYIEEYCHNFLSIDGMAVGSDYELALPQCPDMGRGRLKSRSGRPGGLRGAGHGLTFCEFCALDTDIAFEKEQIGGGESFYWKLSHKGAKAYVECEERFAPAFVSVWAVDHLVCPEVVHGFFINPGETHTWAREWRFGKER